MAVHKDVSFHACLLVLGMFQLISATELDDATMFCTMECGKFSYAICPRSEGNLRNPICTNCCAGYKGCNYYSANGTFICEGNSDPRKQNISCPKNCDSKIVYSKCPLSEGSRVIENIECTSCCTGYKGCYYFGLDGKFVCEGKRSEPKICTQQCDPKVAYMICPSSGSTKLLTQICVNCCTAKAGCKLYGHDGSLLCTGKPKIH